MFGIGSTELVIILVFGFLLFGPDKLPQMGRTIGRALRQFRETQEKLTAVVQTEVVDPMAAAAQSSAKKAGVSTTVDEDADADAPAAGAEGKTSAEPARKETFAERRARLAAEKAKAEAAQGGEDAAEGTAVEGASSDAAASDVVAAGAESAAPDAAASEAPVEDEPAVRTTEDLYARRPRKRKQDAEAEAVATEVADNADAAAAADTDAAAATEPAATEGGEQ